MSAQKKEERAPKFSHFSPFLSLTNTHAIDFLLTMGELGMVLGPSGVGKSVLIKQFLPGLTSQQCEAVYCHLTQVPSSGLLKSIATRLGETPRRGKDRLYEQVLDRAQRAKGTLLLIFDEAHLLTPKSLIDLRLLISSALDVGPPLRILLVKQDAGSANSVLRMSC